MIKEEVIIDGDIKREQASFLEYVDWSNDNSENYINLLPGNGIRRTNIIISNSKLFSRLLLAIKEAGTIYDNSTKKYLSRFEELVRLPWVNVENDIEKILKVTGLEIRVDKVMLHDVQRSNNIAKADYSRWIPNYKEEVGDVKWQYRENTIDPNDLIQTEEILRRQGWKDLLFPFAFSGACEMATKRDVLLTVFMGGGKTRLSIAISEYWREVDNITSPTIVLALRRHFKSWVEEMEKLPNLLASSRGKLYETWFDKGDVPVFDKSFIFISLERLVLLNNKDMLKLRHVAAETTIILDESYTISNRQAKRTQAVFKLQGKHHISCSGTPIKSFVTQLLPILQWTFRGGSEALPDYPTDRTRGHKLFEERFLAHAIGTDLSRKRVPYVNNLPALYKLLNPLMYRRLRNEPEVIEALGEINIQIEWIDVNLNDEHKALYEAILLSFTKWYARELKFKKLNDEIPVNIILIKLGYLIQAVVAPWKLQDHSDDSFTWPKFDRQTTSFIDITIDLLVKERDEGHISVVFGYTVDSLKLLYEQTQKRNLASAFIYGGMDVELRDIYISAFQRGEFEVLIGTYGVLSESINLSIADRVILTEAVWVPSTINQAIARVTRGFQENEPKVYFIRAIGTVQEFQLNWCALKQHSINAALDYTVQKRYDEDILDIRAYASYLIANTFEAKEVGRHYEIESNDQ